MLAPKIDKNDGGPECTTRRFLFRWLPLAVAITIAWGCLMWRQMPSDWTFSDLAAFGDTFGAVNSLMTAVALAGSITAVLLQRHEIRLQANELRLQAIELAKQREEMEGHRHAAEEQAWLLAVQRVNTELQNDLLRQKLGLQLDSVIMDMELKLTNTRATQDELDKSSWDLDRRADRLSYGDSQAESLKRMSWDLGNRASMYREAVQNLHETLQKLKAQRAGVGTPVRPSPPGPARSD